MFYVLGFLDVLCALRVPDVQCASTCSRFSMSCRCSVCSTWSRCSMCSMWSECSVFEMFYVFLDHWAVKNGPRVLDVVNVLCPSDVPVCWDVSLWADNPEQTAPHLTVSAPALPPPPLLQLPEMTKAPPKQTNKQCDDSIMLSSL